MEESKMKLTKADLDVLRGIVDHYIENTYGETFKLTAQRMITSSITKVIEDTTKKLIADAVSKKVDDMVIDEFSDVLLEVVKYVFTTDHGKYNLKEAIEKEVEEQVDRIDLDSIVEEVVSDLGLPDDSDVREIVNCETEGLMGEVEELEKYTEELTREIEKLKKKFKSLRNP